VIAWYAKNLTSGEVREQNADAVLPSASTIKVLLALAFWRAVQRGELRAAHPYATQPWAAVGGSGVLQGFQHAARITLADLVHLSLAVSDNYATNIVASFVGLSAVNALAAQLGLAHTAMQRNMMDEEAREAGQENLTCARDLATLIEEVATGTQLGEAVCAPVLRSLELQEHRDALPRRLPAGVTYAGKPGELDDGYHYHDCGLLSRGNDRIVMAVMTAGEGGPEAVSGTAADLFAALAQP
jgi:beta-lactamase class A